MASAEEALDRLCDPAAEVSAHYLIERTGAVWRLVPEEARAWHAGAGFWGGTRDVNSASLGIELDNDGRTPFAHPQMQALERLLPEVMARWSIPPAGVIGHSDMAPARKADPGPRFDWARLARQGLALGPGDGAFGAPAVPPGPVDRFRDRLIRIGYDPELSDALLLRAFRLRFRPWATGPRDGTDDALAADLAARSDTGLWH